MAVPTVAGVLRCFAAKRFGNHPLQLLSVFLGIGLQSPDPCDKQSHSGGLDYSLNERLKHFQHARKILKYDPCAVKCVDAEE